MKLENIESCFLGLAIGDALGVPVEFSSREKLKSNPVISMRGYGYWNQPPGTWSDDSSLAFCLAESLLDGYEITRTGSKFVKWMSEGYWGAHHEAFDIGGTTRIALQRIAEGEDALFSGEIEEDSNGNGSLMRIAPACIYFSREEDNDVLMEKVREISGITHRHFRSVFSCFVFTKFMSSLFQGTEKKDAYFKAIQNTQNYIQSNKFNPDEIKLFERLLSGRLINESKDKIQSSGYVLHTLEASIWCFINSNSYEEAVLKAVNLGGDTDTTGCVTGALAGLYYGKESIPIEWQQAVARKDDIIELAANFRKCILQ